MVHWTEETKMRIEKNMDLAPLMRWMGQGAGFAEAAHMREQLVAVGAWKNTDEVPEDSWNAMVQASIQQAKDAAAE